MAKQYIVIACSGGKPSSPTNDVYVAFALPSAKQAAEGANR